MKGKDAKTASFLSSFNHIVDKGRDVHATMSHQGGEVNSLINELFKHVKVRICALS